MNKRRTKRNYKSGSGGHIMEEGKKIKGFLISCSTHKEKFAIRDAYRIINQFYIQEYGDRFEKEENDIIDEQVMKNLYSDDKQEEKGEGKNKKVFIKKKFLSKQVKINAKGLVFVKIDDTIFPEDFNGQNFVELILKNAKKEKIIPSKDIFRFIPIEIACKASMPNFENFAEILIKKFLNENEENLTWSMVFKCRCNNKFNNKYDFLSFLETIIPKNYRHLDYKGDITFFIDITQHFMCLAIFRDFDKLKKFSFINLLNENKPKIKEEKVTKNKNEGEKLENVEKSEKLKNEENLRKEENVEKTETKDVNLI